MAYKKDLKFLNEQASVPIVVIVGGEEKEKGGVKVRDVATQAEVWY